MKKKFYLIGLSMLVSLSILAGCTGLQSPDPLSSGKTASGPETLRAMTFNIYYGGVPGYRRDTVNTIPFLNSDIDGIIRGIKAAKADIVCIQEKLNEWNPDQIGPNMAAVVAKRLGWYFKDQHKVDGAWGDLAFISKYPIVEEGTTESGLGVMVDVPGLGKLMVFNIHGMSYPYQPYQLNSIEYKNAPFITKEKEAIHYARKARGALGDRVAGEFKTLPADLPVLIMGDHNEPSGDDWTQRAADAGLHPIAVNYPLTGTWKSLGMTDTYRKINPDEVKHPGVSWMVHGTPKDKGDHDRIDFIFARELPGRFEIKDCQLIGPAAWADIIIHDGLWISDHNAFVATLKLFPKK
ncbi:MAG: endonuclease/exonuclease/phosphatase family protein [Desulfobacterium sp.]|nr:endonuclease/exonuclease/phosphatase family protein [Desulfobacterium sp.]